MPRRTPSGQPNCCATMSIPCSSANAAATYAIAHCTSLRSFRRWKNSFMAQQRRSGMTLLSISGAGFGASEATAIDRKKQVGISQADVSKRVVRILCDRLIVILARFAQVGTGPLLGEKFSFEIKLVSF